MGRMPENRALRFYFQLLRELPFITSLEFKQPSSRGGRGVDGILRIGTPKGIQAFAVEVKRSYLDRTLLNGLIALRKKQDAPLLLLARYVPTPSAERLMRAGISFVDLAGNMHLVLGDDYARTVIGRRQQQKYEATARLTPATVQLLFTLAASDEAGHWSVRQLADASGLSKSNVARVRTQLVDRGLLRPKGDSLEIPDGPTIEDELLRGYELALRPKLLIGRFRSPESDPDVLPDRVRETLSGIPVRWSLTGGPAAYQLQHFYRGQDLPLFLDGDGLPETVRRTLRLIPDRSGPILFLRSFGTLPFWKEINGVMLAHPWLIYVELMNSQDPRAHEAAQEIRREYLTTAHA